MGKRARPWAPVHPDTGERRGSLPCWVEVYDGAGRLVATVLDPLELMAWGRSRRPGSEYRVLSRCGGITRSRCRLSVKSNGIAVIWGFEQIRGRGR